VTKNHTQPRGRPSAAKNNNKQKPPNTLLSSQTTHPADRPTSPRLGPRASSTDGQGVHRGESPSGCHRAQRTGRVATASPSYARDRRESNNVLGSMFRLHRPIQRARPPQYSACRGAGPAIARTGSRLARAPSPRCRSARC